MRVGGLILSCFLALSACNRGAAPAAQESPSADGPRGAPQPEAIFGTGALAYDRTLVVAFERAGVIRSLEVDVGDVVAEGQVLAALDDADLRLDLAREQAGRRVEQASLGRLRGDEEQVRLREEIARREASRSELLAKAGAIPEIERDQSQDAPRLLVQERRSLDLQREVLRARMVQAQVREAQARLWQGKTVLKAASAGRVIRRDASAGGYAAPGAPVLVLAPAGSEVASLWVHESELPHLRSGAKASLTLRDRDGTRLSGKVHRIHPEADPRTHEVRVDVRLERLPENLVFGVRVDGQIQRAGGGGT
jgi:multidrug resistance efflux pump